VSRELLREYPVLRYAVRGMRGRFRSDVIASGAAALVEAQSSGMGDAELLRFVQHACRRAARREMSWDKRVSFGISAAANLAVPDYSDLWESVNALPPRQRRAVVMRFWDGMSNTEVAKEMAITEVTVKATIQDAFRSLKINLGATTPFRPSRCVHITEGEVKGMRSTHNGAPLEKSA